MKQWVFDPSVAYSPKKNEANDKNSAENKDKSNTNTEEETKKKGRPLKLDSFKQEIIRCIAKGVSYAKIAKLFNCHLNTLKNYIIKQSLLPVDQDNLGSAQP